LKKSGRKCDASRRGENSRHLKIGSCPTKVTRKHEKKEEKFAYWQKKQKNTDPKKKKNKKRMTDVSSNEKMKATVGENRNLQRKPKNDLSLKKKDWTRRVTRQTKRRVRRRMGNCKGSEKRELANSDGKNSPTATQKKKEGSQLRKKR